MVRWPYVPDPWILFKDQDREQRGLKIRRIEFHVAPSVYKTLNKYKQEHKLTWAKMAEQFAIYLAEHG